MHHHVFTTILIIFFSTFTLSTPVSQESSTVAPNTASQATPTQTSQVTFDISLPWQLSNIIIFEASTNSTVNSSISFVFEDPNPSMQMSTICTKSVQPGQDLTSNFYAHCAITQGLQFQYDNDQISIYRFIKDPR
jgi:hypothetical protein